MINGFRFSDLGRITLSHLLLAERKRSELARIAQILDLAEDSWRNVYAGEREVRPRAPTIPEASPERCLASSDDSQLRRV